MLDDFGRRAARADRLVHGDISMTLSPALAVVDAHLTGMTAAGVEGAVLAYAGLSVLGADVFKTLNNAVAAVCAATRGRFAGTAHVDPANPEPPVDERERCAADLGLPVALPCSGPEWSLDAPTFAPTRDRIEEIGAPVVLHPALLPGRSSTDYGVERRCARPADTVEAVVCVLNRVPTHWASLRFVVPHLGGGSVFLKGRIAAFFWAEPLRASSDYRGRTASECRGSTEDSTFAERWARQFDTAGTSGWAPPIEFAAQVMGADHLVFGTDYPLEAHTGSTYLELAEKVRRLPLADAERTSIAHGTAGTLGVGTISHPPILADSVGRDCP